MRRIHLSPPDIGELEREYLLRALDSGWVAPTGPDLDRFEDRLSAITGWPGAVAVSSGTAALHLALLLSGVGPGDDVAVSTLTFVASASAIVYCGAKPVFIDSERESWNMDPGLLAAALSQGQRPAAVVAVDLYGQCADYDALGHLCRDSEVALVEDAAEALGATHRERPAGTLGDVGVFSFNGNKIATTSGGGMVVTSDRAQADRVRHLATQARQPTVHYEHHEVGYNYRLSNLLAAIGTAQLQRLPAMIDRRLAIHDRYRERLDGLQGLTFMPIASWGTWNGWLTCILLERPERRDAVIAELAAHDIESRPLWKPLHQQRAFAGYRVIANGVSDDLFRRGVCLPSGSTMTDEDVDLVARHVAAAVRPV